MLPTLVNDKHIISIDLGTTYSGIAHSVKGVDPICHIYSNHINATKTRTCILYDQKNRICGIGSPAYDKYFLLSEAEQKNYYLIMGPKKVLFDNPDSDAIICENGKSFKVVDVLADFLTKLIEEPMNAYSLQVSDVHWICSVPANWEKEHVLVLRHALFKAGMIDRIDEDLTFLLEPECAAVHVLKKQTINNNEKYLVMDLGGGTVDWTAVENQNQKLKTSRYSDAINAGSSLINDKIIEIIKNKMGTYSVHLTSQLIHDIDRKWEDIKLHLQNFDADVYLRLDNVSPDLAQCPLIKRKAIILSSDELKKAFYPIFDSIIDFTQTIVDKERFDKIVCVGGFASCVPLIERIKQEFSSECEILVPDFAVQSVLLGGAYLGRDPSLITSRRSKYGYGIESEVEFDSKRHPISKMKKCPGSRIPVVCEGIYTPIIAHNQEVKKGFNVEKRFTKNQNENVIIIKVYSTTAPRVSYVDDPCCVIKETMRVDVSGLQQGEVFRVQFSIDNSDGMNQLHIAVVPDDIGKRVTTTINFDTVFRVNHF